jgi:hypothetical protein
MGDKERTELIAAMGNTIGGIDAAIRAKDQATAMMLYLKFLAAAGFLAQEIDELDNSPGN